MKFKLFYKNFFIILTSDLFLILASFLGAHLIRFEFNIPRQMVVSLWKVMPLVLIVKIICFYFFDLYSGMWRYTSISDLLNVIKASCASTFIIVILILFSNRFEGFSRSVFLIDLCLTILFIAGFRLIVRLYFEQVSKKKRWRDTIRDLLKNFLTKGRGNSKNLLIIGAGDCGEKMYREIRDNAALQYNVVGFLDDHPVKIGKKIHGVPVLSSIRDIKEAANKVKADEALIAIPSASAQQMRRIVDYCKESGITFKTIPGYGELINGRVTINSIREVDFRDLLGREIIKLEEEKIGAYLQEQRVMVTGAGGSIGSELCRQICRYRPDKILLYERAESPLYEIELELKQAFEGVKIVPLLADIQNRCQLEKAFETFRPHTVFHAAAYKHVPMLELHPWKAIENNILGTENLVDVANRFEVERFVFVSTDKAVRPVNVMGASKRVVEILIQNQNICGFSKTRFMTVRFGNVVGSVGSVVPLFKKQIEKGGPVTVTHPDITRYFMTVPEACQLILQSGAMGQGGEIFLLDMGTPIRIDEMARDLIRLSGFEPEVDIKIKYIGLRPGEKLYEELITEGEGIMPTSHNKIMVLKGTECNLQVLNDRIIELAELANNQAAESIKEKLKQILPEYRPAGR
ncbi:MAG TPA: nucleoside-diphosphate sugar epimerase/dehydratase [Desulfobacterales bacterium]|nr:nucleoside-diphosphate sugar epimerase/dehydratase [Desulfobacterales bacterium]